MHRRVVNARLALAALPRHLEGGVLKAVATEVEGGQTFYEIESRKP